MKKSPALLRDRTVLSNICGNTLQQTTYMDVLPEIIDKYNHTYHRAIKCMQKLAQERSNYQLFNALYSEHQWNVQAIDEFYGIRDGNVIKADFYNDCAMIPDPAELNVEEKILLILDDCLHGKQNKAEAYYMRG